MTRTLTVDDREAVIGFEMAHLGMTEHPPSGGWSEPGRWYAPGFDNAAWCAMFQSWSFYQTLGFSPFPATSSKGFAACVAGAQWFRRQGKWVSGDATPKRGWQIYFIWTPGDIEHHVGLVLSARGPRDVQTIQGNTSNRVALHHRGGRSIAGYGIIDYHEAPGPHPVPAPTLPSFTRTLHLRAMRHSLTADEHKIVLQFQKVLKVQAVVHHAPDQDPGTPDGDPGERTVNAWLAFKRGVNAACRYRHIPEVFATVDDTLGPKGLGILTWWSTLR